MGVEAVLVGRAEGRVGGVEGVGTDVGGRSEGGVEGWVT